MTKSEIIEDFFKKCVLPVASATLLYLVLKSFCTKNGKLDIYLLWMLCGIPFGLHKKRIWVWGNTGSVGGDLGLFSVNFIIAGLIGGFVLLWRLFVAALYIPWTIYRLWDCSRNYISKD